MTELLQKALEAVRRLPADDQDEIARAMLRLAADPPAEPVHPADREAVLEGLGQARDGVFASDDDVQKVFRAFEP